MVIFIHFPLQRAFENGDDDMGNHLSMGVFMGISPIWAIWEWEYNRISWDILYRQFDMTFGIV